MKREGKVVLAFIGSLWIIMPSYIVLHEGGHALIAFLCGAEIIEFNILEGHVIAQGGIFNEISFALFYAAGLLAPVMIFTIHLILYRSETEKDFYRVFSAVFSAIILFSIGVWVVMPALYMLGMANPNDDVVRFIEALKIPPLIVMILASLLMSIYSWGIWKKKIFENGCKAIKSDDYAEKYESDDEIGNERI